MRKYINLIETLNDYSKIESPFQHEMDLDEIDYENNWKEILEYPDSDEQFHKAFQASGAIKTKLPNIYITDEYVINCDGHYASVYEKRDWLSSIDPTDFFPNYEQEYNDNFWKYPCKLYHATTNENIKDIEKRGLLPKNKTRGLSNRSVGSAVFTTSEFEETYHGSYGDVVFEIDTNQMANDGYKPFVSEEPPIIESELTERLANYIKLDDYETEVSSDISPYTIIVYGNIPPKYLIVAT